LMAGLAYSHNAEWGTIRTTFTGDTLNRSTYKVGMVLERVEGKNVLERMTVVGVSKETHKLSVEDANGNRSGLAISAIDSRYGICR
ncbi:hypothetical protein ISX56_28930, partial [Serratia ureilytica]|nr:hypothetical protein [Serratia ureilytica]